GLCAGEGGGGCTRLRVSGAAGGVMLGAGADGRLGIGMAAPGAAPGSPPGGPAGVFTLCAIAVAAAMAPMLKPTRMSFERHGRFMLGSPSPLSLRDLATWACPDASRPIGPRYRTRQTG